MDSYKRISKLHKADALDFLVTKRKSELTRDLNRDLMKDLDPIYSRSFVDEYLSLRAAIVRDLSKVKTRLDLLKVFHALRLDYYVQDLSKVSSEDLYDMILRDEELFNRP